MSESAISGLKNSIDNDINNINQNINDLDNELSGITNLGLRYLLWENSNESMNVDNGLIELPTVSEVGGFGVRPWTYIQIIIVIKWDGGSGLKLIQIPVQDWLEWSYYAGSPPTDIKYRWSVNSGNDKDRWGGLNFFNIRGASGEDSGIEVSNTYDAYRLGIWRIYGIK